MKAWLNAIVVVVMVCIGGVLSAQDDEKPKAESKTVSFSDTTEAPAEEAAVAAAGRRKLSDREARRLGITFLSVRSAVKELKTSGAIDGSESHAELAAIVADHISSKKEHKAAYAAGVDWDALLAFITKLLDIIMKFFA